MTKGVVSSTNTVNTSQPARGEVRASVPVAKNRGVVPSSALPQSYQNWEAVKQANIRLEKDNIRVGNNEWISKSDFAKLSSEDQAKIQRIGVSAFQREFEQNNIKVGNNEWMSKADYASLSDTDKARINQVGITAFNTENATNYQRQQAVASAAYTTLSQQGYATLSTENGTQAYQVEISRYLNDKGDNSATRSTLHDLGYTDTDIDSAVREYQAAKADYERRFAEAKDTALQDLYKRAEGIPLNPETSANFDALADQIARDSVTMDVPASALMKHTVLGAAGAPATYDLKAAVAAGDISQVKATEIESLSASIPIELKPYDIGYGQVNI